jgi:cyclophilin family peptidyl-prolyl cis-trans isomerase
MVSRKERIKDKREQELKEQQQVRIVVGILGVLMIIGVAVFIAYQNGAFEPAKVNLSNLVVTAGSPEAICEQATPAMDAPTSEFPQAEQVIQQGVDYRAIFCTDVGAIYLDLFEDRTPVTVNNMVFLAQNNYYNNTIFHRVLDGFMAQGGDPTGTGSGGPGYQFQDEVFPDLAFDRPYLLAMANAGAGTNGSQFFITFVPTPHLNMKHTIFGEVLSGHEVVDSIMLRDPQIASAPATTLQAVVIVTPEQVTIGQ